MRSPLLGVVGVEDLQPAHLAQVTMEIGTAVFIVAVSVGGIGTQLGESLGCGCPAHRGRGYREQREHQLTSITDYIMDSCEAKYVLFPTVLQR